MLPIVFSNDLEIDKEPHVQSIQKKPQELRIYSRRVGQPQKQQKSVTIPEHCQEPEPEVNTQMNEAGSGPKETGEKETQSEEQEQLVSDLDVPIALRKGTQTCTQHPLYNFMSFNHLSPAFRAVTEKIFAEELPRSIHEALEKPRWRKAALEAMKTLIKWHMGDCKSTKREISSGL